MNRTLLAIGDESDWDSYMKFFRRRKLLKNHRFGFAATTYDSVLEGDLPTIPSKTLVVFPFFPFAYWDKHIEPRSYRGLYGSRRFYVQWKELWRLIAANLKRHYRDKTVHIINSPKRIPLERDKEATKQALAEAGIRTPRSYRVGNIKTLLNRVRRGTNLFIKVRYGSMGKGITYLEEDCWQTNFAFRKGRIRNRHSDYGWKFRDVTGHRAFLRHLLKADVIVEEAIPRWLIKNAQFDLRFHVFYGKILYEYARFNAVKNVTTNTSQGAKAERLAFLKDVRSDLIDRARTDALNSVRALGLDSAGVDIMLDPYRQEPVVIEVNGFPGYPKVRTFDLGECLVKEIGRRRWEKETPWLRPV